MSVTVRAIKCPKCDLDLRDLGWSDATEPILHCERSKASTSHKMKVHHLKGRANTPCWNCSALMGCKLCSGENRDEMLCLNCGVYQTLSGLIANGDHVGVKLDEHPPEWLDAFKNRGARPSLMDLFHQERAKREAEPHRAQPAPRPASAPEPVQSRKASVIVRTREPAAPGGLDRSQPIEREMPSGDDPDENARMLALERDGVDVEVSETPAENPADGESIMDTIAAIDDEELIPEWDR